MENTFCRVHINFDALIYNFRQIKNLHGNIMPVVKSNAYALGANAIATVLQKEGAEYFASGTIHEALALREAGITKEILPLLGAVHDEEYKKAQEKNIVCLAHNQESLEKSLKYSNNIAIKLNSGMGRLGFKLNELSTVINEFKRAKITPNYVLSHYASADIISENGFMQQQTQQLDTAIQILKDTFPDIKTSLANSAALVAYPDNIGDIARAGKILYGGNPLYGTEKENLTPHLRPVHSVTAPILSINYLKRGDSLSYMQSFIAERDTIAAWVAIGYANGYRRSNRVYSQDSNFVPHMNLLGHHCPVLGYITMQMTAIDITDIYDGKNIQVGDEVYIIGGKSNPITVEMLAHWWNTIPHEVTTSLGF